jgi:enamine deaminase RidA (YjgF/YER057c/UK114 family)
MSDPKHHVAIVDVPGWPAPKGYVNGVAGTGRVLFVAGQVGWDPSTCKFASASLVDQLAQALDNVLAVVRAAGGAPEDIARMTVFVTDLDAYRGSLREVGRVWRERMGKHFPAMALVGVSGLVEKDAVVEIEATAVLKDGT